MSKPDEIGSMVRAAEAEFGSVDVLVNNAGIQHVSLIEEFPDAKWDSIIAINLSAAFHSIKAVMPGMKRRKWGRIINVASRSWPRRQHRQGGLCGRQVRTGGAHQGRGARGGQQRRHLQRHLSRLGADAPDRAADRRSGAAQWRHVEQAKVELLREKQPMLKFTTPEEVGGPGGLPQRRRRPDHNGLGYFDRRRLDRSVNGSNGANTPRRRLIAQV